MIFFLQRYLITAGIPPVYRSTVFTVKTQAVVTLCSLYPGKILHRGILKTEMGNPYYSWVEPPIYLAKACLFFDGYSAEKTRRVLTNSHK